MRYAGKGEEERLLTPQPLYGQVRQLLVEHIRKGDWMVGDALPNEGDLAKRFGVSIGTIRKAIEGLENNGLVKRIQGRGTYVAGIGSHVLKEKFIRLRGDDEKAQQFNYELLSMERVPADLTGLDLPEWKSETELIKISQRVRFGRAGCGLEVSLLPAGKLPNFERHMTFGQTVYPLLADYAFIVTHARERLTLTGASAEVADVIGVTPGELVPRIVRVAYCIDKSAVCYRVAHYAAREFNYDIEID